MATNVGDGRSTFEIYDLSAGENLPLGGQRNGSELKSIIGGQMNVNNRDDDVYDVLSELIVGTTDGNDGDTETVPGIAGLRLIGLTGDGLAFRSNNTNRGEQADIALIGGEGTASRLDAIDAFTGDVNVRDSISQLDILTVDMGINYNLQIGGTRQVSDEFRDVVGGSFQINPRENDLEDVLSELLVGTFDAAGGEDADADAEIGIDGVELVGLGGDTVSIAVSNGTGAIDTLVFEGSAAVAAITAVADANVVADKDSGINFKDGVSDFAVIDVDGDTFRFDTGAVARVGNGELRDVVGGQISANASDNDLEDLLSELFFGTFDASGGEDVDTDDVAGIDGVALLGITADSVALSFDVGDSVDTILFTGDGTAAAIAELDLLF